MTEVKRAVKIFTSRAHVLNVIAILSRSNSLLQPVSVSAAIFGVADLLCAIPIFSGIQSTSVAGLIWLL